MWINMNGTIVPSEKAMISVFDHGLLYGDGVFEGIRVYSGNVFRLQEHLDRLYYSAKAIMLKITIDKKQMIKEVVETVAKNKITNGYIRLVVTRGVGDLGLDPRKCKESFYFVIAANITLYPDEYYKNGLTITTVAARRNISEALDPKIKSLNYLNNILAKIEASNHGSLEAIMINNAGSVSEATGDNVFITKGKDLITPDLSCGVLDGVTRKVVMEIGAKLKMNIYEKILSRYDLYTADECFLTGTAAEVIPVVKIDAREIGDGKPGKWTKKIITEFHKVVKLDGVKVKY